MVDGKGGQEGSWLLSIHARFGSEMITIMEPWGAPRYESPAIDRVLGYRPMESFEGGPEGGKWTEMIHPDDVEKMSESVKESLAAPGEHPSVEYRIRDAAGSWRWFESRGVNLVDDPEIAGVVVSTYEITERKRTEHALAESERRLRAVAEGAPVILFAFDTGGTMTFDTGSGLSGLGLAPGSTLGLSAFEIYKDRPQILQDMRRALAGEEVVDVVELKGSSGSLFFDTRYSPLRDAAGEIEGVVGVATDVTERKRLEEELSYRATHDPLTDLPNRALFMDRLEHSLQRLERDARTIAVLMLDPDGFKGVNDSWGHDTGDVLLVSAARRLEALLRPSDTVCRLGGDEFAMLLENADDAVASRVAQRLVEEFTRPFEIPGVGPLVPATVSIGIALHSREASGTPPAGEGEERQTSQARARSLLKDADRAMYEAKSLGKAGYRKAYTPG